MKLNNPTSRGGAQNCANSDQVRSVRQRRPAFWQAFRENERGNLAVLFSVLMLPALTAIGGAVDYGQALRLRSDMQSAVDAGVVGAAKAYVKSGSEADANAAAETFYRGAMHGSVIGTLDPVGIGVGKVSLTARATQPTAFLALMGIYEIPVSVSATAAYAGRELELSVMVDTTGSMGDDDKMDDLKDAAEDLLDIVMTTAGKKRRVALVPFAQAVNVGEEYFSAVTGWQPDNDDADGDGWKDGMPSKLKKPNKCPKWKTDNVNKYNNKCKHWEAGEPDLGSMPETCVVERVAHYDKDTAPEAGKYFGIYEEKADDANRNLDEDDCKPGGSPIIPLTQDRAKLETAISNLPTSGYTAGHLGTAWAWYMLSPKWQSIWTGDAMPGAHDEDKLMKVAILMTDGEYNTYYESSNGNAYDQAEDVCTAMKADGIEVYTIAFDVSSGSNAANHMEDCASTPDHYHNPYNGQQLRDAFRAIGNRIAIGADGVNLAE